MFNLTCFYGFAEEEEVRCLYSHSWERKRDMYLATQDTLISSNSKLQHIWSQWRLLPRLVRDHKIRVLAMARHALPTMPSVTILPLSKNCENVIYLLYLMLSLKSDWIWGNKYISALQCLVSVYFLYSSCGWPGFKSDLINPRRHKSPSRLTQRAGPVVPGCGGCVGAKANDFLSYPIAGL